MVSHSVEQTEALGERLGRVAEAGWAFALSGDLGAGKTAFVRGLARGLGCRDSVHSPTYSLVNEYRGGRLPFFHLDLYRLDGPEAVIGAGLDPFLNPRDFVVAVEWPERWLKGAGVGRGLPDPGTTWLWVRFGHGDRECERRIDYDDPGT